MFHGRDVGDLQWLIPISAGQSLPHIYGLEGGPCNLVIRRDRILPCEQRSLRLEFS